MNGPDHHAANPSSITESATVWALAAPVEPTLHELPRRHLSGASETLSIGLGL